MLKIYRTDAAARVFSSTGFTLLEVMIAIAVLAITLTVLFGSQSQSLSLAAEAKFNTQATFLLQEKMAELEAGQLDFYNDEGDFGEMYPGYRWKIEIDDVNFMESEILAEMAKPLKRVTLTIVWGDSPFSHAVDYYMQERNSL
ncbi:MAG: type II secretion system protein [Desulfopila sp.]|jgi:general secretion pathway protein I|nr:type II secretion system protein [Desulfopila sp.]